MPPTSLGLVFGEVRLLGGVIFKFASAHSPKHPISHLRLRISSSLPSRHEKSVKWTPPVCSLQTSSVIIFQGTPKRPSGQGWPSSLCWQHRLSPGCRQGRSATPIVESSNPPVHSAGNREPNGLEVKVSCGHNRQHMMDTLPASKCQN